MPASTLSASPPPTLDDAFLEAARERRLVIQRCANCGALRNPPTPTCPLCHSLEIDRQVCSGRGTVVASLRTRPPHDAEASDTTIVLVALEEGAELVSNLLIDDGGDHEFPGYEGRAVEVDYTDVKGFQLPVFRLVADVEERS